MAIPRRTSTIASVIFAWAAACLPAVAQSDYMFRYFDPAGDAHVRRADYGNDAALDPSSTLPDIRQVSVCGWMPDDPVTDPYRGQSVSSRTAHIFRLQLVIDGLVNPPGSLGSGGTFFEPFQFGPSPVYGFIEIDMDDDRNTGGELGTVATTRYLANVGRFGVLPTGSIRERAARSGLESDWDDDFYTEPYFERSGAEFELALCGCFPTVVVAEGGDQNGQFDAGETWIVQGRFFRRAGGYREASAMFGGSEPQLYDPVVQLQFSHEIAGNRTSITLVYSLDMQGAAMLTGQPQQPIDSVIDLAGNHSSVAEAIQDVIDGANGDHGGPLTGPVWHLAHRWAGKPRQNALDVEDWRFGGLVGTACINEGECPFAWTDVGFDEDSVGDMDGDGDVDSLDANVFDAALAVLDGSWEDADGTANGVFVIGNFAANFNLLDFDYDGVVGPADREVIAPTPTCPGDFNSDGFVNSQDFLDFLTAFFSLDCRSDVNMDGFINSQDFFEFLSRFFVPC
ncbi:MAG: GC-type dockerin domain-anchored protein [Phycisphaerales bacterium]